VSARPDGDPPALRFVAGNPTPEEIAAVTAVLLTHRHEEQPESGATPGRRDQFRRMRLGMRLRPGRGAWRRTRPEQ
jgi:hypothetical protein